MSWLNILMLYIVGAIAETLIIYKDRNFYLDALKEYCKQIHIKFSRFNIALFLSAYALLWPLDIFYMIYYKYFDKKK